MRVDYVLEKLPHVSAASLVEAKRYTPSLPPPPARAALAAWRGMAGTRGLARLATIADRSHPFSTRVPTDRRRGSALPRSVRLLVYSSLSPSPSPSLLICMDACLISPYMVFSFFFLSIYMVIVNIVVL